MTGPGTGGFEAGSVGFEAGSGGTGYPVRLPVAGRRVVVTGSGVQAAQAAGDLAMAGADVLVVAASAGPELADLLAGGRARLAPRWPPAAADLDGSWLVLACGPDPAADAEVAELAERTGIWCLRPAGQARGSRPDRGRRVLVLGGARSGKSTTAERMLAGGPADYVATGLPPGHDDPDWDERIRLHRERRPASWRTIETLEVAALLARPEPAPVLLDCVGTWLARVMDDCGLWQQRDGADKALAARVSALAQAWQQTSRHVVAVSNEVGSGVVPGTGSGRRFRDELGALNARLAAVSDEVWLCTAGIGRRLR